MKFFPLNDHLQNHGGTSGRSILRLERNFQLDKLRSRMRWFHFLPWTDTKQELLRRRYIQSSFVQQEKERDPEEIDFRLERGPTAEFSKHPNHRQNILQEQPKMVDKTDKERPYLREISNIGEATSIPFFDIFIYLLNPFSRRRRKGKKKNRKKKM